MLINEVNSEIVDREAAERRRWLERWGHRMLVRRSDSLLNALEELNLHDAPGVPSQLMEQVLELADEAGALELVPKPEAAPSVTAVLDAMFEVQARIMPGGFADEGDEPKAGFRRRRRRSPQLIAV